LPSRTPFGPGARRGERGATDVSGTNGVFFVVGSFLKT
jgi:hypothetical protein